MTRAERAFAAAGQAVDARFVKMPRSKVVELLTELVEALRKERLKRLPELMGPGDAAAHVGIAQSNIARHPNFPEPVAEISTGKVYLGSEVRAYRDRLHGGDA